MERRIENRMRKIVAVHASPRDNGNSSTICNAVLDGAMGLSTNIIEVFHLNKLNAVRGCQNCGKCKETGRCAVMDDISPILDSIKGSDSLVIAVPMFFGHASAQYRLLEDRMYSFLDRNLAPTIQPGKKVSIIVTYDEDDIAATSLRRALSSFYEQLGFEIVDTIMYSCNGRADAAASDEEILYLGRSIGHKL